MRSPILVVIILSLGAWLCGADPDGNAATAWRKAWETLPAAEHPIWLVCDDPESLPDADADALFSQPVHSLSWLAVGAGSARCDWGGGGVARAGLDMPLPHLDPMHRLIKLATLHAAWCASRGDRARALAGLDSCIRALRLLAASGCLLERVVWARSEYRCIQMLATLAPAAAPRLRAVMQDLVGSTDDGGLGRAIAIETRLVRQRIDALPDRDPGRVDGLAAICGPIGEDEGAWSVAELAAGYRDAVAGRLRRRVESAPPAATAVDRHVARLIRPIDLVQDEVCRTLAARALFVQGLQRLGADAAPFELSSPEPARLGGTKLAFPAPSGAQEVRY